MPGLRGFAPNTPARALVAPETRRKCFPLDTQCPLSQQVMIYAVYGDGVHSGDWNDDCHFLPLLPHLLVARGRKSHEWSDWTGQKGD